MFVKHNENNLRLLCLSIKICRTREHSKRKTSGIAEAVLILVRKQPMCALLGNQPHMMKKPVSFERKFLSILLLSFLLFYIALRLGSRPGRSASPAFVGTVLFSRPLGRTTFSTLPENQNPQLLLRAFCGSG